MIAAGLAAPAPAAAFTVSVGADGTMTLTDGVIVGITYDGTNYNVLDASSSATAVPPCAATGPDAASCPAGTVARINATATLALQLDDGGGPDAVEIPSTMALTGFNSQGYGGDGDDVIVSNVPMSQDDFRGGPGNDTLRTGQSNGNVVMDQLDGGPGNDVLDGGVGPDAIDGGPGTDRLEYPGRTDALAVTLPDGPGSELGNGGSADGPGSRDQIAQIENVTGGSGADSLTGNLLANAIAGGAGDDQLAGVGSDDALSGGTGNDQLGGGEDDDTMLGEAGADQLAGDAGDDSLRGGAGPDRLLGGGDVDVLLGELGIDRLLAKDGRRDARINCGPGKNRRERARRDRQDPRAKSC